MKRFFQLPIDWFLLIIPITLVAIGITTIYTITYPSVGINLTMYQLTYFFIGLIVLIVLMFSDYRIFSSYPAIYYIASIIILAPLLPFIAPHVPYVATVFGATRWIDFGFFQFQPSEIFKFFGTVVAAAFLSTRVGKLNWRSTALYAIIFAVPIGMVLVQPNLGTAAVLFLIFLTMFLSAAPSLRLKLSVLGLVVALTPIVFFNLRPYQMARIQTFFNPTEDPTAAGYNVTQSIIAVGSGGLTGRGFGQGSQTVLDFLPVPHADFIFAGFAEATGFVGSVVLLALFGWLLFKIIDLARVARDPFVRFFAIGIAAKIFFQLVIHVGMNIGVMPVTGIPLPFVSYGGTALIIDMATIGVLSSMHIRQTRPVFA